MSDLAIRMTSDDQQLAASVQKLDRDVKQVEASLDKVAESSRKSAAAAVQSVQAQNRVSQEGKRIADSLLRQNENLSESWDRQRTAINEAHRDGKLSAEQHARALELLEKKISDTASANRAKARAARDAADAEVKAALEATDAYKKQQTEIREGITLTQRMEDKNKSLTIRYYEMKVAVKAAWESGKISAAQYRDTIRSLDQELDSVTASQKEATSPEIVSSIAGMAAGWLSIQSAVRLATLAVREYNEERDKGRSETESLQESRSRLFQVSNGDFAALEARADRAAEKYGVDRALARQVLFTARSEGFEDQYEQVMKVAPIINPAAASTVAGQVRTLFARENVSVDSSLNAVLEGARNSRLSFEGIAAALPMIGEGGRQQGASMDESIAAASVLSSVFKSGETTGDRLKAYLSKLALNPATRGKGLVGGYDALMAMPEADRLKFLGDSTELNAVQAAMHEFRNSIVSRTGEVAAARMAPAGTQTALNEFFSQGHLAAFKASQQAKVSRDTSAEMAYSADASMNQAYRDWINSQANRGKISGFDRFMENRAIDVMNMFGSDVASERFGGGMTIDPVLFDQFLEYQKQIAHNTGSQSKPTGDMLITRPGEDK